MENDSLFLVRDLTVSYTNEDSTAEASRAVSVDIGKGEIVGLYGESGCGKTTLAMAMIGLLKEDAVLESGTVQFEDILMTPRHILDEGEDPFVKIRGKQLTYVLQNPESAFDPTRKIGVQTAEVCEDYESLSFFGKRKRAAQMLAEMQIGDPEKVCRRFPMQVSGGILQRAMIAVSLANHPRLIIMDEPFSKLDAVNTAHVTDILKKRREEDGTSVFLISHDLDILENICDRVMFMDHHEIIPGITSVREIREYIIKSEENGYETDL